MQLKIETRITYLKLIQQSMSLNPDLRFVRKHNYMSNSLHLQYTNCFKRLRSIDPAIINGNFINAH